LLRRVPAGAGTRPYGEPMNSAGGSGRHRRSRPPYTREPLRPGDPAHLGVYELLGRLGSGAYGQVYVAQRPSRQSLETPFYAVKLLPSPVDLDGRARFRREVHALQAVNSRHVVHYVDHGESPEGLWLVTELLVGAKTLASARRKFDGLELLGVLQQMLVALRDLHGAGVTHRDLHPGNVMITDDGGVKVIDLGLSLHGVERVTASPEHLGHLVFTPPEQRGIGVPAWDPASDVFAWATTSAFAAQGRGPQRLEDVFAGPREAEDYDLRGVERSLGGILRDCLEREPANRISTDEVLRRLLGLQQRWSAGDGDVTTIVLHDHLWVSVDGQLTQHVRVDPVFHRGRTSRSTFDAHRRIFDLPVGTPITLHGRGFTAAVSPRVQPVCPDCATAAVERALTRPADDRQPRAGWVCPNHLTCLAQVRDRVKVLAAWDFSFGTQDLLRFVPYEVTTGEQSWHEGMLARFYARDGGEELAFDRDDELTRLHRFTGLAPALFEPLLRQLGSVRAVLLDARRQQVISAVLALRQEEQRLQQQYEVQRAEARQLPPHQARLRWPAEVWGLNNPVHSLEQVGHLIGTWRAPVFDMWEQVGWLD
jgi:hypothetical protein